MIYTAGTASAKLEGDGEDRWNDREKLSGSVVHSSTQVIGGMCSVSSTGHLYSDQQKVDWP